MFAQSLADNRPPAPFIILSAVDSSNNYAMAKLHAGMELAGWCFLAVEQTAGKGQRGRQWMARSGENITMSAVFQPAAYHLFLHSAAAALACYDFIKGAGAENVSIKWPNDIYIGDRKAAGILLETVHRKGGYEWLVAGTGINLNQETFNADLSRAVSLRMVTGRTYDLTASAKRLHRFLAERMEWLGNRGPDEVMEAYNALLYRRGEEVRIRRGAAVFNTRIREVTSDGTLVTDDVIERRFAVGEIEFV